MEKPASYFAVKAFLDSIGESDGHILLSSVVGTLGFNLVRNRDEIKDVNEAIDQIEYMGVYAARTTRWLGLS